MDLSNAIAEFIEVIQDDPRISPAHVSLFLAVINTCKKQNKDMPISIYKKDIIKQAKIAPATFHRRINELHKYGYLIYKPSYNPLMGSLVYISKLTV
jgi:hypothetical protein